MSPRQCRPARAAITRANTLYCIFFLLKGLWLRQYLKVRGWKGGRGERAPGCQLILRSAATNANICGGHIITELSEPFSGPQLPTAYEKTPIKQLSLKVGPNSVI